MKKTQMIAMLVAVAGLGSVAVGQNVASYQIGKRAVKSASVAQLQQALQNGVSPSAQDADGESLLMEAVETGNVAMVEGVDCRRRECERRR